MRAMMVLAGVAMLVGCSAPGALSTAADPNSPEVVKAFEQYDCDRNGVLTFAEVKDAQVAVKKPEGGTDAFSKFSESLMDVYDNDESGGLDKVEMAKMWRVMEGIMIFDRPGGACGK